MTQHVSIPDDLKAKLEREASARNMTLADLVREVAQRAKSLMQSTVLTILRPDESDESDELAALDLFQKYADQSVSFTDCVSFVLMDRFNIQTAFTFDRHFSIAGFDAEP